MLVDVGILAGVGVGGRAVADAGVGRARGRQDRRRRVGRVHRARPAGPDVYVVEVRGAVGVGLGPFAAEGGAEAVWGRKKGVGQL